MRALASRRTIGIRNPKSTRPWQHVLEPLSGYLLLAEQLWSEPQAYGEAWNFGPPDDDVQPVEWIVSKIVGVWGDDARWELIASDARHEATLLKVDAAKARARLSWSRRLSLASALEWSVEWYKGFAAGKPALTLTEDQISRFEKMGRPEPK